MIVTDKFTLVHMHKTGGQTLIQVVNSCIPNNESVGYQYQASMSAEPRKYWRSKLHNNGRNPDGKNSMNPTGTRRPC
jgi:hypothetical protein